MVTADFNSVITTRAILLGESSVLQWKDEVPEYAMFLDYYFNHAPYDLGERSRYSDAKCLLELIHDITNGDCRTSEVYGTLLTKELLSRPPKGKHIFIPEDEAIKGVEHLSKVVKENSGTRYIFAIGLQTNYYLQKLGVYSCGELTEQFLKGAEPRRIGVSSSDPFYQPVNAKPFREVCFRRFKSDIYPNVEIIPILPVNSYPLMGSELNNFGEALEQLKASFRV